MLEFIQLLNQRYQSITAQLDNKSTLYFEYQARIEQLLFAEAFIRKALLIHDFPKCPLQIAVIGPTQSGKSSIVNLLLGETLAGVSPLAGYTMHAQGFCHEVSLDALDGLQQYFGRFQRVDKDSLSKTRFDCFAISATSHQSDCLPACVVWDTPDFDSIDATDYREGVIRTLALADMVILTVSKEKYADQSVWDVMKTIAAFSQPMLVCLNKLAEDSETLVIESFKQKWQQSRSDKPAAIVPLLFQKGVTSPIWPMTASGLVKELSKQIDKSKHSLRLRQFLQQHWRDWLEPVFAEHRAQRNWEQWVDQSLQDAITSYQRDYLDHPHHYNTFQAALLNLLSLLEIPGLAKVMSKTRRAMTWPLRKLMHLGKGQFSASPNQEIMILNQIGEHVLLQLADKLLEIRETETATDSWWRETATVLRQQRAPITQDYRQAVSTYHLHFQTDVEAAAHRLYHKLEEQPLILNSLRATRLSTDAGAMLLAVQAGGIGVHDLVITPMVLSITSLLAESAIGGYMHRVEAELKQHQLQTVKTKLFHDSLRQHLYQLPQLVQSSNRFNISDAQCQLAEQALQEKKHGLRIL